jgi:hypothetical protein
MIAPLGRRGKRGAAFDRRYPASRAKRENVSALNPIEAAYVRSRIR